MNMMNAPRLEKISNGGEENQTLSVEVTNFLKSLKAANSDELGPTVHEVAGYVQNNIANLSRDEAGVLEKALLEKAAGISDIGPALDLLREKSKSPFLSEAVPANDNKETSPEVTESLERCDQLLTILEVTEAGLDKLTAKMIKDLELKIKDWKEEKNKMPVEVVLTQEYLDFSDKLDALDIAVLKKSALL